MSGGIFQPTIEDDDVGELRRNPLLCYLCNEQYEEPCLLSCFHSFCSRCLCGRASDGQTACPLCGVVTEVSDKVPPPDPLLKFLVESSVEERVLCANCDQPDSGMFFCNTCNQPLCVNCREDTHKARMFRAHDIVKMSKRTKDIHRKCTLHNEPYIMFCKQKKTMLCINCFRDTDLVMRSHCIDLDSAYNQGCKKLDQAVQQIRQLQNSVQDAIAKLKNLLDELHKNSISEKDAISNLFAKMQEKILHKKDNLLQDVDRQYQEREFILKEQLTTLNALLPTLHINLVTCTVFSSSANKYEFLDLAFVLINRLQSIADLPHPIHMCQGSTIRTDYKLEFARCLETLLSFRSLSYPKDCAYTGKSHSGNHSNSGKRLEGSPVPSVGSYGYTNGFRRNGTSKVMFVEARGAFAEHCKEVDSTYKEIMQKFEKLKTRVQELQRDLTLRRCLIKKDNLKSIVKECQQFGTELSCHLETLETKRPLLDKHWEETCQMISDEQEIYQAQLNDTMRLSKENEHVITIVQQLEPFIKTITDVTQRLAPKLSKRKVDKEDVLSALLEQINTMQPDSQHRVEAIQAAQEDRETINAKKSNPMDDALIETKGRLKTAHRDSEGNRLSDPWLDHAVKGCPLGRVLDDQEIGSRDEDGANSCDKQSEEDNGNDSVDEWESEDSVAADSDSGSVCRGNDVFMNGGTDPSVGVTLVTPGDEKDSDSGSVCRGNEVFVNGGTDSSVDVTLVTPGGENSKLESAVNDELHASSTCVSSNESETASVSSSDVSHEE